MLLGAHVPTAGGPANALANGEDRACEVIQIFNQSPRAWKGRLYKEEELDAYRAKLADSPVQDLVIHAIYLINCASEDPEIRTKALDAADPRRCSAATSSAPAASSCTPAAR